MEKLLNTTNKDVNLSEYDIENMDLEYRDEIYSLLKLREGQVDEDSLLEQADSFCESIVEYIYKQSHIDIDEESQNPYFINIINVLVDVKPYMVKSIIHVLESYEYTIDCCDRKENIFINLALYVPIYNQNGDIIIEIVRLNNF